MNRRTLVTGLVAGSAVLAGSALIKSAVDQNMAGWDPGITPQGSLPSGRRMNYRPFGRSGLKVSEVGFGAWAVGGKAYGSVEQAESLNALARAEELGCNFVDTAMVYGQSEVVLGDFLKGRRDKWLVSTKFSGQEAGLEATLEQQLQRLGVDAVDLYMVHWVPTSAQHEVYEALHRVKKAGKARLVGFSLYTIADISRVLRQGEVDGFMVAFSLLDPDPYLAKLDDVRESGMGVIVRSSLKEGFLTGKYARDAKFPDPDDQRHSWSAERIAQTVDAAENFRFLEQEAGSMMVGAASYPLSFRETSTVVLGTKSLKHAETNFGVVPGTRLAPATLRRIETIQRRNGLYDRKGRVVDALRSLVS